jgi:hypothetical protein
MLWWTLGIATLRKTVNVLSFNKIHFVERHVYNVKSANPIQKCNIGVYIQRNTIAFCPLTNWSTQINKAGFLATNSLHRKWWNFEFRNISRNVHTAVNMEPSLLHSSAIPWKAAYGQQVKECFCPKRKNNGRN